jgi:hypothetical protein
MRTEVPCESVEVWLTGHEYACKWGVFRNAEGNPLRQCGIQPLIVATAELVERLLREGRQPAAIPDGSIIDAYKRDDRIFTTLEWQGNTWTWEMFKAHWWDGRGMEIMVGRWPD